MSPKFMLDTNMVSHIVRQRGNAVNRFRQANLNNICLSVISYGEIIFGLEKRPEATGLNTLMRGFIARIDIAPWTTEVAGRYGALRALLEKRGKPLGDLDLLIAAHALQVGATLVTADRAFAMVDGLACENWLV